MANIIKQKRGTTDPGASDLVVGELAINTTDGGVFTKTDGGTVVEVGGSGGATDIDGLSDAVTYNSGQSIGIGANALDSEDGGSFRKNTAVGYDALTAVTTGQYNVALGYQAGKTISTASKNTAIGVWALRDSDPSTDDSENTAVGYFSQANATTGIENTSVGAWSAYSLTTGTKNVAVGVDVLKDITTGSNNTAVGHGAAESLTTGTAGVYIGSSAGYSSTTSTNNAYIGFEAAYYSTGSANVALGWKALYGSSGNTTGSNNTCIGKASGSSMTSGATNTFVGSNAGDVVTTGSNNTCLGFGSDPSSATASNEVVLGDASVATLRCNTQTISSLSDGRDKTEVEDLPLGLDFIDTLRPVKFKWDTRDGNGKDGSYEAGFIAQELQSVQRDADADYLGLVMDENPDRLEASYGKLVPMLVKAIQELKSEVEQLKANA
tara:strand:+ start:1591 stop:2901 length:1311 start_codon:yes stop_codon:yes gene_type:complete